MNNDVIRFEEKTIFRLRSLYKKYGYLPYKMSKFEEYELYAQNKDFLVSDRVITFNDTNGKLMALKPDVTLSIIKNRDAEKGVKQKVFYNENVYRVSESTNRFKEILQAGLECIGDIDIYDIYEVICLAAESLADISDNFYIEISNLDIIYSIILSVCDNQEFLRTVINCISRKNMHDIKIICNKFSVSENDYMKISKLVSLFGCRKNVIEQLSDICDDKFINDITVLSEMLDKSIYSDKIKFDFSLTNDLNYYNGFIFKGYIDGIYCSVLAGGQYGNMMKKMKFNSEAVGFALYLDKLDELNYDNNDYDIDYLVLYNEGNLITEVSDKVGELVKHGYSVSAQKTKPLKLRYKKIIDLR